MHLHAVICMTALAVCTGCALTHLSPDPAGTGENREAEFAEARVEQAVHLAMQSVACGDACWNLSAEWRSASKLSRRKVL